MNSTAGGPPGIASPATPRPAPKPGPGRAHRPALRRAQRPAPTREGMLRSYRPPAATPPPDRRWRLSASWRFALTALLALAWPAAALLLCWRWIHGLVADLGVLPGALLLTFGAFVPATVASFVAVSTALDRPRHPPEGRPTTPVTVLIPVRDVAGTIRGTLDYLAAQDYDGDVRIVLVDYGSTDDTIVEALKGAHASGAYLSVLTEKRSERTAALNRGLATVTTPIVITVSPGTLLHRSAVRMLVARLRSAPSDVDAVAGHLLVRNSRAGLWARVQAWDYLLGIAAMRRVQAVYEATLVADGAFSAYRTNALRRTGGWPPPPGEDLVLTWRLLLGGRVDHEPLALAFTDVPATLRQLARHRARRARGTLEGLSAVPPWVQSRWTVRLLAGAGLLVPLVDIAYAAAWVPGLLVAALGDLSILAPMVVTVVPVHFAVYAMLYVRQQRRVLGPLGLRPRRDVSALLLYLSVYPTCVAAMSLSGYLRHVVDRVRTWVPRVQPAVPTADRRAR